MVNSDPPTYKFGIEIECLLELIEQANNLPRRAQYNLIKKGMDRSLRLAGSCEKVMVHGGDKAKRPSYEVWNLKEDSSIEWENSQGKPSRFP